MVTIDQLSEPEDSVHDVRPVLTPLTFRHDPSSTFAAARTRASPSRRHSIFPHNMSTCFPTFMETVLSYLRTAPHGIPRQRIEELLEKKASHLLPLYRSNIPFYHHYHDSPVEQSPRSRRKDIPSAPRVMYLTSATLIVVPSNLLSQWNMEVHKHCHEQRTQRFLVLYPGTTLPTALTLANDYDVSLSCPTYVMHL